MLGTVGSGYDAVEAEVRELVRRRGLDPVQDRQAMRQLIDGVVVDYDDRSLTSSLPPLADPATAARAVYDAVAGFGPLQRHLDDPEVEEIWVKGRLPQGSTAKHCSPATRAGQAAVRANSYPVDLCFAQLASRAWRVAIT